MEYALAQLNLAVMKYPLESGEMAEFTANLDRINQLAESSSGFIWRLQDESGDATALRPFGDDMLVNLSLWQDVDSLHAFVFDSAHKSFMKRRSEWFDKMSDAYVVLWWLPSGELPTLEDAGRRIACLRSDGPGPEAFTFRERFPPPGNDGA